MNFRTWVDPRVQSVGLTAMLAYLASRGWRPKPYPRPELLVFEGPFVDDEGESITQTLPSSEKMRDYRVRVEELITSLSELEERHPIEVLNDILSMSSADSAPPTLPTRPLHEAPTTNVPGRS